MSDIKTSIIGTVSVPFHGIDGAEGPRGKSAYETACENGFVGSEAEWLASLSLSEGVFSARGITWEPEKDILSTPGGERCTLREFENSSNSGKIVTIVCDGEAAFDSEKYSVRGSSGSLAAGDLITYVNGTWHLISAADAVPSALRGEDGKYLPQSGAGGLLSAVNAACLADLISALWSDDIFAPHAAPEGGHKVNRCLKSGFYLGGLDPECENHPPVTDGNGETWLLAVFNNIKAGDSAGERRLQIAIDVLNGRVFTRCGSVNMNSWYDWKDAALPDGGITFDMLSEQLKNRIASLESAVFNS